MNNNQAILNGSQLSKYEYKIGRGSEMFPILYTLSFLNFGVYAYRFNKINCQKYLVASVLLSYPLAKIVSQELFGNKKIRDIERLDSDTHASFGLYESLKK